eukprot:6212151-Pleurochrysis_carterae.AAC.5
MVFALLEPTTPSGARELHHGKQETASGGSYNGMGRCARLNTVIGTVASPVYAASAVQLAITASKFSFSCVVTQESLPAVRSELHMLAIYAHIH